MRLTAQQARELAQSFRTISVELGEYRFSNWNDLTKTQRDSLENAEWTLLNYSSDLITLAVGLTLDDAQASLENILDATKEAKKAVETIKNIQKVIVIAGATIKLGAAIVCKDPGLIASAAVDLVKVATEKDD